MGERYYSGHFIGSAEKAEQNVINEAAIQQREKMNDFKERYNLDECIQDAYVAMYGHSALIPLELEKKLLNHLQDEFEDSKASPELVQELIEGEVVRYIKMFGRKSH
jgi:RNA:NAD 2'-phosphotransferase (TPT1/KptA family)